MDNILINDSLWQSILIYGSVIVIAIVATLKRHALIKFVQEVRVELGKCTWPWDPDLSGLKKYKSLIDSSVVVIVSTVLLAGYTSGFDFLLNNLVAYLVSF